jgi:hypothetical protein
MANSEAAWARRLVARAELGDRRRNARAAKVLESLVVNPGATLSQAATGNEAARERFYRHARATEVNADELLRSGCLATVEDLRGIEGDILLVGDTTVLSYRHAAAEDLGLISASAQAINRGWQVHTVLAVNSVTGEIVGPVEQLWWTRPVDQHGKRHQRLDRQYEDKESFKWESSLEVARSRLGADCARTITVTDRESDVYEYFVYLVGQSCRFVARCTWNRRVLGELGYVFETAERAPKLGQLLLSIEQKGGRPKRQAQLAVRSASITLRPPKDVASTQPELQMNVVSVCEENPPAGVEPVRWLLFTSEPVQTFEQAYKVVLHYARRWRIEEFHKCWKSEGTDVESLRMATAENLRRVAILQVFVATKLMQLRDALVDRVAAAVPVVEDGDASSAHENKFVDRPCDRLLTRQQWRVLWVATEHSRPPIHPPSAKWASLAIAKMGSWVDTKRIKRPGYRAYFRGWQRLMDRCDFLEDLQFLEADPEM